MTPENKKSLHDIVRRNADPDTTAELVAALRGRIERPPAPSFAAAPLPIRQFMLIHWLDDQVGNGGLAAYFGAPLGDFSVETAKALRWIKATKHADSLEKAIALFPGGKPPADAAAREQALAEFGADALDDLDFADAEFFNNPLDGYLLRHVKDNFEDFLKFAAQ
ncbi:MAG: DUF4375 domain-containing protein [Elusimicrobiota bacterium]